jgi:hypothetical protein
MEIRLTRRVANLGNFSPKNTNLRIFLAFGDLEDFSIPKHVSPFFSSYLSQEIHIFCGKFASFWGNFMYFWGILGDF